MPRRSKDFEENDEIYEELNNHDKGPAVQWRTKKEMMIEADELRQFFKTSNWKIKLIFLFGFFTNKQFIASNNFFKMNFYTLSRLF